MFLHFPNAKISESELFMGWKDSFKDSIKKLGKAASDSMNQMAQEQRKANEIYNERLNLLKTLKMSELKHLKEEWDIEVEFYDPYEEGTPRREDYIEALSRNLDSKLIEEYIKDKKTEGKLKFIPKTNPTNVTIFDHSNIKMEKSSITGNVYSNDQIISSFYSTINESDLDISLKLEAAKKLDELKKELDKPEKDKSKVQIICDWFLKNGTTLATLATPFIEKILTML